MFPSCLKPSNGARFYETKHVSFWEDIPLQLRPYEKIDNCFNHFLTCGFGLNNILFTNLHI